MSKQKNIYQGLSGVSFLFFLGSTVITMGGINGLCWIFVKYDPLSYKDLLSGIAGVLLP